MEKNIDVILFSDFNSEIANIVEEGINITMAAMYRDYGESGLVSKFSIDDYGKRNYDCKNVILNYCADKTGIGEISDKKSIAIAFSNPAFESLYNSIMSGVLTGTLIRTTSPAIMSMANVESVDIGDSYTWEIDTKGLPVAQRASYGSNVALLDSYSIQPITITPKPWSLGATVDYIRILSNGFDLGKEIARIAMAMLYAQYKAIVNVVFNTTGHPIYNATFSASTYVSTADNLTALNNAPVTAYGTRTAWQAINALATSGGYVTKDDYIRNNFLQKIYGVDSAIVDQATDFSAPLTGGAPSLLVPNDKILMISSVGDKPSKLVRENYVRVIKKDATSTSLHRTSYSYFMSFDVALATQAHYGIQAVAST